LQRLRACWAQIAGKGGWIRGSEDCDERER